MELKIPELSLVVLIGVSGSGKSTFAQKHFGPFEVVSSDRCRGIISNDENDQGATSDAFELLHFIISKRLKKGLLTVVDATNVQERARKNLVELARSYHCLPVAIVLDMPEKLCIERNESRPDRNFKSFVIRKQRSQLKRSIKRLKKEGFRYIYTLKSQEEVDAIEGFSREKLYSNKKELSGPFDIIGDIHGCYEETRELLDKLGYQVQEVPVEGKNYGMHFSHPEGRKLIFLGDLVDRGPNSPAVLRLVMSMVNQGIALCVPGNHDARLQKRLRGKDVNLNHGLAETLEQLKGESPEFLEEVREFIYSLTSHYVLDAGRLVVVHAGILEEMQGRGSGAVRSFCIYGEHTGEIDEYGLRIRYNWAKDYRGKAKVIYGHTVVREAVWLNKTLDIDTGCVFGGKLTAFRYPEEEIVEVEAKQQYWEPLKPFEEINAKVLSPQQEYDDLLNIEDVLGKRIVQTRLYHNITLREENSIAALEVMSRFALNPKWLIYLPPTMSPCGTSDLPDFLEHPTQALNYYKRRNVEELICEEKHMGSRAVLIICKHAGVGMKRFGLKKAKIGVCYTRTGRNFFTDAELEQAFLERVSKALTTVGFWDNFQTEWVCLDAELMPWSAKAQALLKTQYASVGAAASGALPEVVGVLEQTAKRGVEGAQAALEAYTDQRSSIEKYIQAYRQYCWPVQSLDDYKLAPFHILATEGAVHTDKDHVWHMEEIHKICEADETLLRPTPYKVIHTHDPQSMQEAVDWWRELTEKGGEGMVVKPRSFVAYGKEGLLQPAVKCRGKEYLRIIYGPEYDKPEHMKRLKKRGLSRKRSLALREFALGVEALERFVRKEPLRRTHESVFGVLALESEEVDPRL